MGTSGELRCLTAIYSAALDILGCLRYLHGTGSHDIECIGELMSSGGTAEARWRHLEKVSGIWDYFLFYHFTDED